MNMTVLEDPRARLARVDCPDNVWLWCTLCERFFQYKSALPAFGYAHDACPFDNCCGYGVGFHLYWWDDMREPEDPRWPSSADQLVHGMKSPDMEPFYQAQLEARIHALVSAFARAPERTSALGDAPPRYLGSFLQMASDLCWDLTVPQGCEFAEDTASIILGGLPVWSQTADSDQASIMTAELRAFFAFAERTRAIDDAGAWLTLVTGSDLDEIFRHTMRTDRRLSQLRRPTRTCRHRPTARASSKRKRKQQRRARKRQRRSARG